MEPPFSWTSMMCAFFCLWTMFSVRERERIGSCWNHNMCRKQCQSSQVVIITENSSSSTERWIIINTRQRTWQSQIALTWASFALLNFRVENKESLSRTWTWMWTWVGVNNISLIRNLFRQKWMKANIHSNETYFYMEILFFRKFIIIRNKIRVCSTSNCPTCNSRSERLK